MCEAEAWADFSDRWQRVLDEPKPLKLFKMQQASNLSGYFAGWKVAERDAKLRALADVIIATPSICGVHCTLDLAAFNEILKGQMPRRTDNAYFLAFHSVVSSVCHELFHGGAKEECELMFDETWFLDREPRSGIPS